MRSVLFEGRHATLAGQLYLPPGYSGSGHYPAILVAQMDGGREYAQRLADLGFVTLLFEAAGSCDSMRLAVDYLAGLRFVDMGRIGVLGEAGQCATGDARIKAAAEAPPGGVDAAMEQLTPFFLRRL